MCIFSGPVHDVSKTKIFARLDGSCQYLAYSMDVIPMGDVAMILPLPTSSQAEDAIRFISLKDYENIFEDLEKPFIRQSKSLSRGFASDTLKVHEVGDFVASFVPRKDAFIRLDKRFQLPENVWNKLPQYDDFGFAVFQLKVEKSPPAGGQFLDIDSKPTKHYHPMAFSFQTRYKDMLFFPTVHVHDGSVPKEEYFDHMLYYQGDFAAKGRLNEVSSHPASNYLRPTEVVDPLSTIHRRAVFGKHLNMDIYIEK